MQPAVWFMAIKGEPHIVNEPLKVVKKRKRLLGLEFWKGVSGLPKPVVLNPSGLVSGSE